MYIKSAIDKWNNNISLFKKVKLIHEESLSLELVKRILKRKNTYIWFEKPSYMYLIYNNSYTLMFKRILYGPIVTPIKWFAMPRKNSYEAHWCKVMKKIYSYVLHSNRVRNHIVKYTKCRKYLHKYKLLNPCIELDFSKINILPYSSRNIDVLVYIKYTDSNRVNEENILLNYLRNKYSLYVVKYGNHTQSNLLYIANITKFIIYFSFYDTGALSLVEMKLMGAWPISHQREFIEDGFGSYVKELDTNINKSLAIISNIIQTQYNPYLLSHNVKYNLNCQKSLQNIVNDLY